MSEPVWGLSPLTTLHWRRWADDWVVFDAGSGHMHKMDALTAVALMCLEAAPCGLIGLAEQVAAELDLPGGETLSSTLASVVARLDNLGMIEPATP